MEYVAFDDNAPTNQRWKEIMAEKLKTAVTFEIHCWTEETKEIAMALPFGTFKESTWQYGKIIEGKVTPKFISFYWAYPSPPIRRSITKWRRSLPLRWTIAFGRSITAPS